MSRIAPQISLPLLLLSAFTFSTVLSEADASPAKVIIIRHGEKPKEGDDLSPKGRQRAAALVPFFLFDEDQEKPAAIFAQEPSDKHPSRRPLETVTPLAETLKCDIKKYHHSDFVDMVKQIMTDSEYDGKTVLICWEHHGIPYIATEFGIKEPPDWLGHDFDRLWVITFKDGKPQLQNLPQKLLYGDSAQ